MWKDREQDFTAIVDGANNPSQAVIWSVTGNTSAGTMFSGNILYTGADEEAEHFTVTARSVLDPGKSGASTVNIVRPVVTGVTIIEQNAAVRKDESMEFHATVEGLRGPDQDIVWSVEGNSSEDTKFAGNKLIVAKDEKNPSWTVKATSVFDKNFSAAVMVKLSYHITLVPTTNGNINAYYQNMVSEYAPAGEEITIKAVPAKSDRYKLGRLEYADSKPNPIDINTGTFFMPPSDITVSAVFNELEVGDRGPGGGWIFYRNPKSTDSWKYLECAPTDAADTGLKWGPKDAKLKTSYNSDALGKDNTSAISNNKYKEDDFPAAKQAKNYQSNGLKGWYLPNKLELETIHSMLKGNKDFMDSLKGTSYWSFSEEFAISKQVKVFYVGLSAPDKTNSLLTDKDKTLFVRAVRQF
jgi:hypothetical protein